MRSAACSALALAFAAGCAWSGPSLPSAGAKGLAARAEVAGVPFHPQEARHCGPAALATVLGWSGEGADPERLAAEVFTPGRGGTLQSDLVAGARRHGRLAYPVEELGDLLRELDAGHPVLVLQNLGLSWWPVWHYAVAVGYDLRARSLVLRSGRERRRVLPLGTFDRTWARAERWGLAVLPAGRLPATASERVYLEAAAGLERAGRPGAAARAHAAALARWPESLGAWVGLGNARYALGERAGAERAFRRATRLHPDAAAAHNNLAHVLAERGERAAALAAARRAVALGGADAARYRATLEAIEGKGGARAAPGAP